MDNRHFSTAVQKSVEKTFITISVIMQNEFCRLTHIRRERRHFAFYICYNCFSAKKIILDAKYYKQNRFNQMSFISGKPGAERKKS